MGQCCNQSHTVKSKPNISKKLSIDFRSKSAGSDDNLSPSYKHHALPDYRSSDTQSTLRVDQNQQETDGITNTNEYEDDEVLDLSVFHEEVSEFIDFWYQHHEIMKSHSIHNALVARMHNKLKGNTFSLRIFATYKNAFGLYTN